VRDQQRSNDFAADPLAVAELIRKILAADIETRLLVVPRQQELESTFDSIGTEKKLLKAYDMME